MNLSSHSSPLNGQSPETEKNSNDLKRKILQEIQIGSDPKRWRISESPQKKHRNAEPDIALDQKYEEKTLELSEDFIQLQTFHYRPNKMENNYEKWSKVVRKSYLKARSKFERQATKKFKKFFHRAFDTPFTFTCGTINNDEIEDFDVNEEVEDESDVVEDVVDETAEDIDSEDESDAYCDSDEDDSVKHAYLSYEEALPPMIYWTECEMNILGADATSLSHVPYISELDAAGEALFTEELLKVYPDGIHGVLDGYGGCMNEFIFYWTLKYSEDEIKDIEENQLYDIMYDHFPNQFPKNEIKDKIKYLESRFDPRLVPEDNKDDESEFFNTYANSERLLQCFQSVQCRKCTLFFCIHHDSVSSNVERLEKDSVFDSVEISCGQHCFLVNDPSFISADLFNTHEQSLIDLMVEFTDCCSITRSLELIYQPGYVVKNCRMIYDFVKNLNREVPLPQYQTKKHRGRRFDEHRQFRLLKRNGDGAVHNKYTYVACDHKGLCEDQSDPPCPCYARDKICNKYCKCYHDKCKHQFPGCKCSPGNCRTKACPCFLASWECDPVRCRSCRCGPEDLKGNICKNANLQKGLQKRICARPSEMAGWGCFAMDPIQKNDFISEYTGEIISTEEGERRGKVYDKYSTSFLFEINKEYYIDATHQGNMIRFANHSSKNPNCYAQIMVVNTDHRIGIFAQKDIKEGEELFFNYSYNQLHRSQFLNKDVDKDGKIITIKARKREHESSEDHTDHNLDEQQQ